MEYNYKICVAIKCGRFDRSVIFWNLDVSLRLTTAYRSEGVVATRSPFNRKQRQLTQLVRLCCSTLSGEQLRHDVPANTVYDIENGKDNIYVYEISSTQKFKMKRAT